MKITNDIKRNLENKLLILTTGENDYLFRFDTDKKLWNCLVYNTKEVEEANFYDRPLDPIQEIYYNNYSEVLEAIKKL